MWDSDPLIFTILSEHRVTWGARLADNVSRLTTLSANDRTLLRVIPQQHLHTFLYQLSCEEMRLLFSTLRNFRQSYSDGRGEAWYDITPDLLDLRWDLELLPQHGITRLSQWKEGMTEMSEMSRGALKNAVAQRPFISFLLLSEMSTPITVPHWREYIAEPMMRLFLRVTCTEFFMRLETTGDRNRSKMYASPTDGTNGSNTYILYSVVRPAFSDDHKKKVLEEAWEEAVVSSLPLTPRTWYSTVVMAVAGTHVRIGLLTLWEVGADLQHLPEAVKEGLGRVGAAYVCNDDSRACDDLKLLHVIEFCAAEVQTNCFDDVLAQYFCFIAQHIPNVVKKVHMCGINRNVQVCRGELPAELLFPECPKNFVVKTFKDMDIAYLRSIHKKVGHPIYRCGVFNTQYSSERHQHACCIYDYIEGSSDVSISNTSSSFYDKLNDISSSTLGPVCVAVINLHDTLHVCHGDITSDNVIIDHGKWKATFINYKYAVDSIDTKPNANLPSVKALRTFLASMDPAQRKYVKADHWLFHRLADVLAVFQRVWFNLWPQECQKLVEALRTVVAALAEGCSLAEPPQMAARWECTAHDSSASCVSTKDLMLAVLTRWGPEYPCWQRLSTLICKSICKAFNNK